MTLVFLTFFLTIYLLFYVVCKIVLITCKCLCTTGVPGAYGGRKKVCGPLELELGMAVSCYVGAGQSPRTLCNNKRSNPPANPSALFPSFKP